ncbi:GDSL-type esterase/lipase family protein [Streptomyces sp. NPDC057428]|uniref:GDSL-type esterase/lipase family protein n=1 Tax=Streptomyces sp. NPDC057428 TaxID=3346129 RepID=UPI0036C2A09B
MSKLCIIGNSVAASRQAEERPLAGWGQFLGDFLTPHFEVRNYARDAMTARAYYTDRFVSLLNLLSPGDVVAIDFGGVEQRIDNPIRYHGYREFKEFLYLYLAAIRQEGSIPLLMTPVARCVFEPDGSVAETRDGYPQLIREVAAETGTPLVDLNQLTTGMLQELGPQRARQFYRWVDAGEHPNHPDGLIDASHFNESGAREVARLVAIGLDNAVGLPFGMVDRAAVSVPSAYPPVASEFTVEAPEYALHSEARVGSAPVFSGPRSGQVVSGLQKFSGTADPGTSYILFFERGTYIGGTHVGAGGKWIWRRVFKWAAGEQLIHAVGLTEHGVSPAAGVDFTVVDTVEPPVVLGPREEKLSGPRPRFSGTAMRGASQVAIMENGRMIASAPVQKDGTWKVAHAHDWKPGTHILEFVTVFSALHSAPTQHRLRVHGIPEGNWIRESTMSREPCADKCEHLPFAGRW